MQRRKSEAGQLSLRERIENLIGAISAGMYEREEAVAVALLAALCGQNTFLYGPPGTAKSLISRRIASAFDEPVYFEYLMNRFSTPEEVFGPVSIKALKEDRYIRNTHGYLPQAQFAFLDEIWKSSPAILNTLLTLINERTFRNGETTQTAPLKALIAASNETPASNQGLEALFDRFIVRIMVPPISQIRHFNELLNSRPGCAHVGVPDAARIRQDEWNAWLEQIHVVTLSPETLTIIHLIREALAEQHDALDIYVSDRRWQRAVLFMRAAAFFNGRTMTNHSDALLLQHCLWTHKDNYQAAKDIVATAVKSVGFDSGISLANIDGKKENLEREINEELYHSRDVYKTVKNRIGEEVFKFDEPREFNYWDYHSRGKPVYLPYIHVKSVKKFHPVDESGNEIHDIDCEFDGQGACHVTEIRTRRKVIFQPEIMFHRGDKKEDINRRLVTSLSTSISGIKNELLTMLKQVEARFAKTRSELASLFVPSDKTDLAVYGIREQIDSLKLRIKDCERLEGLCG